MLANTYQEGRDIKTIYDILLNRYPKFLSNQVGNKVPKLFRGRPVFSCQNFIQVMKDTFLHVI